MKIDEIYYYFLHTSLESIKKLTQKTGFFQLFSDFQLIIDQKNTKTVCYLYSLL